MAHKENNILIFSRGITVEFFRDFRAQSTDLLGFPAVPGQPGHEHKIPFPSHLANVR